MNDIVENISSTLDLKLFDLGDTPVTLGTIGMSFVIVLLTFVVSRGVRRAAEVAFRRRGVADAGTVGVVTRLLHYGVMFVGLGIALQTAGIGLGSLFAAGAVFAVGIGFAMQNIVQNFVSGVILLAERAIKPGDILQVEGKIVRVVQMGIRAAIVRTRDGEEIIMPNSLLVQSPVVNYTLTDKLHRVRVKVGVTYNSDMRAVREVLEGVGRDLAKKWAVSDDVQVLMTEFGDNSVGWELGLWRRDLWTERPAISQMHEAVWNALADRGIVIAFPQLDVHFNRPVSEGLAKLAAAS